MDSTKQRIPIARVDWTGTQLRVHAQPDAVVDIDLDGIGFARLQADAAGCAVLPLPDSPSGQDRLNLALRSAGYASIEVAIVIGQAGLQRAAGPLPLLPPAADVYVDVRSVARDLRREVVVVVPVYNAPELVRECLDSVLAHTRGNARLIVIDDASPDPSVAPLLDAYRGRRGVELLRNPHNLGFTTSANRGIAAAGDADVVLLNADAQVSSHWLCGLRRAAYASADTASATAVSDNAGAFSVPELEQENPFPALWTFADAALALWQDAGSAYPRLPTGNGFCLYLKRAALDVLGELDAQAFSQGYGEENDWCQRAEASGWRHVIAGNVLVRHARSQSFGHERRRQLGEAGMAVLRARWPQYEAAVAATLYSHARRVLDWRVRRRYADVALPRPRLLLDAQTSPGAFSADWACYRVCPDSVGMRVERWSDDAWQAQEYLALDRSAEAFVAGSHAAEAGFARLLQRYAIDAIAAELTTGLASIAAALHIPQFGPAGAASVELAQRQYNRFSGNAG